MQIDVFCFSPTYNNLTITLLVTNPLTGIDYPLLVSFAKFKDAFTMAADIVLNADRSIQLVNLTVNAGFELAALIDTGASQNTDQLVYGELYGYCIRNAAAPRLIQIIEEMISSWSPADRLDAARIHFMMGFTELLMLLIRNNWISKGSLLLMLAVYGGVRGNFSNFDVLRIKL